MSWRHAIAAAPIGSVVLCNRALDWRKGESSSGYGCRTFPSFFNVAGSRHTWCSETSWVPLQPKKSWQPAIDVLVVRHGESENNVIMANIAAQGLPKAAAEAKWLSSRLDDPGLTAEGLRQAQVFADVYGRDLQTRGCLVCCSPFLRTLQTAAPLVGQIGCDAVVRPDLFEVGGVYTVGVGGKRGGPGKCLSGEEMVALYPFYDVSAVPAGSQWYTGVWETDAEGRARCGEVAVWLRSAQLREQLGTRVLVVVCHGHFIDLLLKELIGITGDPARDQPGVNNIYDRSVVFATPNTSTGRLTIRANGSVIVHSLNDTAHLRVCGSPGAGVNFSGNVTG